MTPIPRVFLLLPFILAACTAPPPPKDTDPRAAGGAPKRVKVDHILIAFTGSVTGIEVKRSKAEAEKLAVKVYDEATKGADWAALKKEYSSDPPPGGPYGLYEDPAAKQPGDYSRSRMVPGFGNVSFSIAVGEIGMATYDPVTSPFGWHIIRRLE